MKKTLAIRGNCYRGASVINILESLGGRNVNNHDGTEDRYFYYIDKDNNISFIFEENIILSTFIMYTIDSFYDKYQYVIGESVMLNSGIVVKLTGMYIDNNAVYYEGQTNDGSIYPLIPISTILIKHQNNIIDIAPMEKMETPNIDINNTSQKLTNNVNDNDNKDCPKAPILSNRYDYAEGKFGYVIPQGYEFDCIKEGVLPEIIIKPVKPKYPTTYEECYDEDNTELHFIYVDKDERDLYESFIQLIRCRNAYWKIAGEQMGLGKPWKPNWNDQDWSDMYYIAFDGKDILVENGYPCCNIILIFPTEEMRDAFYENFKDLIESCKELL